MSQAAAQAQAFYREVAKTGKLWTVRDQRGFPQPMTNDGYRAQPFWSSLSRVQRIVKNVPAYAAASLSKSHGRTFAKGGCPASPQTT